MKTVEDMAMTLLAAGVDLGDERRTLLALMKHGYREGDIAALHDDAVERARILQTVGAN